jgi:hypothetical protein
MFNVLLIDRSNPAIYQLAIHLAEHINNDDVTILFLSDKEKSGKQGNLEVVNISDIPQSTSLVALQAQYDFSLHKTLVTERAFFDYSSFRKTQCYSNLTLDEVYGAVTPYINALDYLIRERVDLVIEGLADNFMTSLAGQIARHYRKKFYMIFMYYWFGNGFLLADRMDQTSTIIDEKYVAHQRNQTPLDRMALDRFYSRKAVQPAFQTNYTLRARIAQVLNRANSYEPLSIKNLILRRFAWSISKLRIKLFLSLESVPRPEKFVLFPLHVTPEATLLGSVPELADQFSLIKNISMNLPAGVFLYVKEHPYQPVGLGLDYAFYKRVQSLPNVRLYGAGVRAESIYSDSNCLAVVVIAGTIGLEAALKRKPVFVFGRPIYHRGDCFIKPQSLEAFFLELKRIMNGEYEFDESALYAILQALKDSIVEADVDYGKAGSWLERGYLGNANTIKLINQQYIEWAASISTRDTLPGVSRIDVSCL